MVPTLQDIDVLLQLYVDFTSLVFDTLTKRFPRLGPLTIQDTISVSHLVDFESLPLNGLTTKCLSCTGKSIAQVVLFLHFDSAVLHTFRIQFVTVADFSITEI